MTQQQTPEELRREIERTRRELGDTVEALAQGGREGAGAPEEGRARGAREGQPQAGRRRIAGGLALLLLLRNSAEPMTTPTDLGGRGWWAALKRTVKEFKEDNRTDWAAALTYYSVLAIFPALIVLVSILGLVGESATQPLIDNLGTVAPGPAQEIFTSAIENLQGDQGAAGVLFVIGLLAALWSASGYVAAFMRASNAIYDMPEGRPVWKTLPVRVGLTIVLLVLLAISTIAVVLTGGLAEKVGDVVGLGSTAVTVWNIAKWPVLLLVVSFMFALLYWAAPNVKQPGFRWVSPGGILAVVGWLIASGAFALYVGNFGSYNKTYGALGGVIVFLVWLWISNIVILLGAEFNAELERGRALEEGDAARGQGALRRTARYSQDGDRAHHVGDGAGRRLRAARRAAAACRLRHLRDRVPRRDGRRRRGCEALRTRPAAARGAARSRADRDGQLQAQPAHR